MKEMHRNSVKDIKQEEDLCSGKGLGEGANGPDKEPADEIQLAVKAYMDGFLNLTDEKKEQMLENIRQKKVKKLRAPVKKAFSAAAILACIVFVGGIGANAASGGKVVESIQKMCGIEPQSVEIIENMTPEAQVYAPILLDCDSERIIFATSRGIVVYGRKEQGVLAVIDLQKIGCNYFTTDTMETKIIVDKDKLTVFNVKREGLLPQGECFYYKLPKKRETKEEIVNLEPFLEQKAKKELISEWEEKMGKRYEDTFELITETALGWQEKKEESVKYSEQSVSWLESGQNMRACLLLCESKKRQEYKLYSWGQDAKEGQEEILSLKFSKEASRQNQKANELPQFVYSGKNEIMRAVCEYAVREEWGDISKADLRKIVVVPAPVIFGKVKYDNGKKIKVFGNFWAMSYYKNGNTLENYAGGEMPACIHLKKVNGGYKVIKVQRTGDGERYQKGIEEFCSGHPEIYQKFFDDSGYELRDKMLKKMMEQYVSDNQLDIRYYHDYGWDPVELNVD